MKYNILLGLFLIALLSACQHEHATSTEVILAGTIQNSKPDSIIFFRGDDVIHKIAVNEEGIFSDTLSLESDYYRIRYQRDFATIYLQPGDSLQMDFDAQKFDETFSFKGKTSAINNYMASKFLLLEEMGQELDIRTLYTMPEDSFVAHIQKIENKLYAHLEDASLPSDFDELEKVNINYEMLGDMQSYEPYHKYFTQKDSFEISSEFKKRFEEIDYANEYYYQKIPEYRDMATMHHVKGGLDSLERLDAIESQLIKNGIVEYLAVYLSPGTEELKVKVDKLTSLTDDEEMIKTINDTYGKMVVLAKGNPSPGFEFKSVDDKIVSLADLKGKNVYIDVWATWCGPCKVEIPHLKKLGGRLSWQEY